MDIEEIHVGEKYHTAAGNAVVTGINREKNRIQIQRLEEAPPGLPQLGYTFSNAHEVSADQIYESLTDHD